MKNRILGITALLLLIGSTSAVGTGVVMPSLSARLCQGCDYRVASIANQSRDEASEADFKARRLTLAQNLAASDLEELDAWWRREKIGDPHKYLLPVILSRLSLKEQYDPQQSWQALLRLDKDQPDLYNFRSVYDIRIFFRFRDIMPKEVEASYRSMLDAPRVLEWNEQGTENHMFMQRMSGLAFMDGSGWSNSLPATTATNEAWLRAELNKFLTIGQGEFHSSTYYGYSIGGLLNLYDFASTPQLRELARAALDWYATNMALRLSWGTAGGAESRGFDRGTWDKSALSTVAWMWWGDDSEIAKRINNKYAGVALLAALSSYRPPAQLKAIALKQVPLPFQAKASHPSYYSYHEGNQFWETFYATQDYSLGTLLRPQRSYQVKGTINAQFATYKLVIRDPKKVSNTVVSLGGTFHSPMATGSSPGDQYVQERGAVIYQLRLNDQDLAAGVPARSHLVLPTRYGQPQWHGGWYIWRIDQTWLCARPWGETISAESPVSQKDKDYQALAANGIKTAWITDVARVADYPDLKSLTRALDKTQVDDRSWERLGQLAYTSLKGDRLIMTYEPNNGIGRASINGRERVLKNWPVLDSPYVQQELNSGILSVRVPNQNSWSLRTTLSGPQWK